MRSRIGRDSILRICDQLAAKSVIELTDMPCIGTDRADLALAGTVTVGNTWTLTVKDQDGVSTPYAFTTATSSLSDLAAGLVGKVNTTKPGSATYTATQFGYLTEAANTVGAYLANALPNTGVNAKTLFEQPRKAYLLLHAEPEFDCANPQAAQAATAAPTPEGLRRFENFLSIYGGRKKAEATPPPDMKKAMGMRPRGY